MAVEPVAGMRDVLAATTPGAEVLDGVAERLRLDDASATRVTVAQAFHWFANDAALAELAARAADPVGAWRSSGTRAT